MPAPFGCRGSDGALYTLTSILIVQRVNASESQGVLGRLLIDVLDKPKSPRLSGHRVGFDHGMEDLPELLEILVELRSSNVWWQAANKQRLGLVWVLATAAG